MVTHFGRGRQNLGEPCSYSFPDRWATCDQQQHCWRVPLSPLPYLLPDVLLQGAPEEAPAKPYWRAPIWLPLLWAAILSGLQCQGAHCQRAQPGTAGQCTGVDRRREVPLGTFMGEVLGGNVRDAMERFEHFQSLRFTVGVGGLAQEVLIWQA